MSVLQSLYLSKTKTYNNDRTGIKIEILTKESVKSTAINTTLNIMMVHFVRMKIKYVCICAAVRVVRGPWRFGSMPDHVGDMLLEHKHYYQSINFDEFSKADRYYDFDFVLGGHFLFHIFI